MKALCLATLFTTIFAIYSYPAAVEEKNLQRIEDQKPLVDIELFSSLNYISPISSFLHAMVVARKHQMTKLLSLLSSNSQDPLIPTELNISTSAAISVVEAKQEVDNSTSVELDSSEETGNSTEDSKSKEHHEHEEEEEDHEHEEEGLEDEKDNEIPESIERKEPTFEDMDDVLPPRVKIPASSARKKHISDIDVVEPIDEKDIWDAERQIWEEMNDIRNNIPSSNHINFDNEQHRNFNVEDFSPKKFEDIKIPEFRTKFRPLPEVYRPVFHGL